MVFYEEKEPYSKFTKTIAGLNIGLFEIMCHKRFKDQFLLARKYRPYKDPNSIHVLDTSIV